MMNAGSPELCLFTVATGMGTPKAKPPQTGSAQLMLVARVYLPFRLRDEVLT